MKNSGMRLKWNLCEGPFFHIMAEKTHKDATKKKSNEIIFSIDFYVSMRARRRITSLKINVCCVLNNSLKKPPRP